MPLNFNKNIFAPKSVDQQFSPIRARLGSTRVSRVGEGVLAIANFSGCMKSTVSCESFERLFRRHAETSTRDACATQKRDQSFGKLRQLVPSHHALPFFAPQMGLGE